MSSPHPHSTAVVTLMDGDCVAEDIVILSHIMSSGSPTQLPEHIFACIAPPMLEYAKNHHLIPQTP